MKKVVICAVPFSHNLGDGVIFQALAELIRSVDDDLHVVPLDIAGRTEFGQPSMKLPCVVRMLDCLPAFCRRAAVLVVFSLKFLFQWRKRWMNELQDADHVIIGGGQLFSDADLNFPVKLYLLSTLLKSKRSTILFVGVARRWSFLGRLLVNRFIANARPEFWVVRDMESFVNAQRVFRLPADRVRVAPDPVIALGRVYKRSFALSGRRRLALGVSDPRMLAYSAARSANNSGDSYGGAYCRIAALAEKYDWEVFLFTNGAREDNDYLDELCKSNKPLGALDKYLPRIPEELVELIAGCDLLIAHRMHANIIAFALGIPSLGFNWDDKVASFFRLTGREDYVFDDITEPRLFDVLGRVLKEPSRTTVDPGTLANSVEAEITALIKDLRGKTR